MSTLKKLARFALADEGSVKTQVVRSGIWIGASNVIGAVLGLGSSIVLARLLTPEVFGLMGLAGVAIRAIESVTRPGVGQALIARQGAFDEAAETAFSLLFLRGLLLALILAGAAPWVSAFYQAEALESVLVALSAVFVIGGLHNIRTIARQKELDFRRLTYLRVTTNVMGTAVTVAVAFWLRSVWALVIGQICTACLNTLLSYVFITGRPKLAWNAGIARELLKYGKFITGSSIVLFVAAELDSAVIGKVLGVEQLGFYTLAFAIAGLATTNLSKVAASIMMPAYSKLQSDRTALRQAYLRTLSLVMFAVLPATAGLLLVAEPLIIVVYGEKWLPAALPLQMLAVFGLFRALAAFSGYLFEGIGLPRIAFYLGLWRLLIVVPLIVPLTLRFGLQGTAITVALGVAVQWLVGLVYLNRHLRIGASQLLSSCWRSLWTTTAMALVITALMLALPSRTLLSVVGLVLAGIIVYVVLNFPFLRELQKVRMT